MECRLSIVRVFVRDFERALRFYTETLGIPLALRSDAFSAAAIDVMPRASHHARNSAVARA